MNIRCDSAERSAKKHGKFYSPIYSLVKVSQDGKPLVTVIKIITLGLGVIDFTTSQVLVEVPTFQIKNSRS